MPLWPYKKTEPGTRWISREHREVRMPLPRYLIIKGRGLFADFAPSRRVG